METFARASYENIPSLWQLMPTYSFLDPYGTLQCQSNSWLNSLNSDSNLSRLTNKDDTDPSKVRTMIFRGNNKNTISQIKVGWKRCSIASGYYPDGTPRDFTWNAYGDGTVSIVSTSIGSGVSYGEPKSEEHSKLVNAFASDAASFINGGTIAPASVKGLSLSAVSSTSSVTNSLSISTLGRVRPLITSPSSQKSGIEAGQPVNQIPDATVEIDVDAGGINIENPSDGTYTATISNAYAEDYSITISYSDSSGGNSILSVRGFNHANTTSFTFTLDSGSTDKITINHTPLPPTGLLADAVDDGGLKTALSWTASSDPAVTGYNIYARYDDEPYLAQIGTSAVNSFNTGDAWAENDTIVTSLYAVSAIKADGTESFLSDMAKNNDRDHDGLTDAEETALGTNLSNPDSDGDGLTDGEEYTRGTNPMLTDTDGDGYSDYDEIQAGTDPLDTDTDGDGVNDNNDVCPLSKPVRISDADTVYYDSLQNAYAEAIDTDTIQTQKLSLTGDVLFNRNISVTLRSGYDCNYSSVTGDTKINGNLEITDGKLIIETGKLTISSAL